jgi:predicted CoA-binding protein
MGLSTRLLASLLNELRLESQLRLTSALTSATFVDHVVRQAHWAVVGDVLNPAKHASQIVTRLESTGRTVAMVNPRDDTGSCHPSVAAAIAAGQRIDAVNLVISPRAGVSIVEDMWRCGVRYLFVQPGADAPHVLARAAELGLVVRTGCVLVEALPDVGSSHGNL